MSTGSGTTSMTSCSSTHSSAMNLKNELFPALMLPSTQSVTRRSAAAARRRRSVPSSRPAFSLSSARALAASSCSRRVSSWMKATWSAILLA